MPCYLAWASSCSASFLVSAASFASVHHRLHRLHPLTFHPGGVAPASDALRVGATAVRKVDRSGLHTDQHLPWTRFRVGQELIHFNKDIGLAGASLMLFAFFSHVGSDLGLTLTGPLFHI